MDIVRRPVPDTALALAAAGIPPVLARVFAARGVRAPEDLDTGLATLPSYALLKGAEAAAVRLADAIARGERIVIVADYDADGATACAVGVRGLRAMGADVGFIVPNRFEFGYGLTPEIVAQALDAAAAPHRHRRQRHREPRRGCGGGERRDRRARHRPSPARRDAAADAVDRQPQPAGMRVPLQEPRRRRRDVLRAAGAARASCAAAAASPAHPNRSLATLLDLVALGTVADVVRLDRVNRTLVAQGLARIRAGRAHPGVAALFAAAGREARRASSYDLGFVAGPRLNAAGRLADMSVGIRCLLADTAAAALPLATELDRYNRERREIEADMQAEALAAVESIGGVGDACSLSLYDASWHQGVVGIVASRLKDRFHRPTVIFARGGSGELKGSGRSIAGLHLRDALDLVAKRAPGLIARFGGHAFAAGLSIAEADLPRFRTLFEEVAREALSPAQLCRVLETDGELAPDELDLDLARAMHDAVWGQGFDAPVFDGVFDVLDQRIVGVRHSKLTLRGADAGGAATYTAMLFGHAEPLPGRIRAAYRPDVNEWNGNQTLQLTLAHWLPAGA